MLRDQTSVVQNRGRRHTLRKPPQTTAKWKLVDQEAALQTLPKVDCYDERPTVIIPETLQDTIEQRALCYFFSSYILVARDPDTCRGFLEYLSPMYQNFGRQSPLPAVTSALSLIILNGRPGHKNLLQPARTAFGNALVAVRKAIKDPVECKADETLMSVLLMGFAEVSLRNSLTLASCCMWFEFHQECLSQSL